PTSNSGNPGGWGKSWPAPTDALMSTAAPVRTAPRPSVAITLTTSGASLNLLMMTRSDTTEINADTSNAMMNSTQYGIGVLMLAAPSTAAPKAPISPYAKLMTPLDR